MDRAKPIVAYRKLPGQAPGLWGYTRLYLGPDHLLQAESTGYVETYKRFYFRDIQALVVVPTGYWSLGATLLALTAGVALILAAVTQVTGGLKLLVLTAALTAVGLSCAAGLGFSLLTGPGCRCLIRTAVQTERLPSLRKYRRALRTLEQLRPLIEQAQSRLGPGPGPERVEAGEPEAPPIILPDQPASPPAVGPEQVGPVQPSS